MLRMQLNRIKKSILQQITQLVKNCPWVHILSTRLDRVHRLECCLLSGRFVLTRVVPTVSRLHDVSARLSGPSRCEIVRALEVSVQSSTLCVLTCESLKQGLGGETFGASPRYCLGFGCS